MSETAATLPPARRSQVAASPSATSLAFLTVAGLTLITGLTHIHLTGDGPEYVGAVYARIHGHLLQPGFWDSGHLLWRPLGYVVTAAWMQATGTPSAQVTWGLISRVFIVLSLFGGLLCAVFAPLWMRMLGCRFVACLVASLLLISSNAFLDYYSGGTAYSSATGLLFLGLFLLSLHRHDAIPAIAAGACLALAVLLWLPFVVALPGALLSPLLRGVESRSRTRLVVISIVSCAALGLGVYAAVMRHLGIHSLQATVSWLASASHGVSSIFGLPRVAIGFPRSFLNIGADGAALKRFMLHDPLNPVSRSDLLRMGLWRIVLFYVVLGVMTVQLVRLRELARIETCLLIALPVLAFAIAWQGGDTERYLALYPAFLLAFATVEGDTRTPRGMRVLLLGFGAVAIVVNVDAHSRWGFAAQEEEVVQRTSKFDSRLLPQHSVVVVPTLVDRTITYFLSGAQDTVRIRAKLDFYPLIQQGAASPRWRQQFATKALAVWESGGRVWLSKRLLAPRPKVDWGWAEGEDPDVSWSDLPRLFSGFDLSEGIDGSDGFIELAPSSKNMELLEELTR